MHTFRKKENGNYEVVFLYPGNASVVIDNVDFEMAIWYVNVLNGGSGEFNK